MPMKVVTSTKPEGKGKKKKVVALSDFNKTKFAENEKPLMLSYSSAIPLSKDVYDVRGYISAGLNANKSEESLSKNDDLPWVVKNGSPDNTIVSVKQAANDKRADAPLCQDSSPALKMWLESFTGIGMSKARPVSASNPAWHCLLPETETERVELLVTSHNKTVRSRRKRESLGKPRTQKASNGFRVKRDGRFSFCGVEGWTGPRPPSFVQLLEQAYKKGFSFALASETVNTKHREKRMLQGNSEQPVEKVNPPPNVPKSVESIAPAINSESSLSTCDNNYYSDQLLSYETWLWQSSQMSNTSAPLMLHDTDIVSVNKALKRTSNTVPSLPKPRSQQAEYDQWLYRAAIQVNSLAPPMIHETNIVSVTAALKELEEYRYIRALYFGDLTNPHIDYGLECRKDPVFGFEVYTRHSSMANAAARFAPYSRIRRENFLFGDLQWEVHVANYQKYSRGIWSLKELLGESLMLWGDNYDMCLFPGIGEHHELLLPRVPVEFKFAEPIKLTKLSAEHPNQVGDVQVTIEATAKRPYQNPPDNYVDSVCNFYLQKGWKNLRDMLVLVPEALDASTGTLEASPIALPTSKDIDKICRLKTG